MTKRPRKKGSEDWSPEDWPATKVEMRPISWIKPYPMNPRTHPPAQLELLARSMRESGVTNPILVDEEGTIIAGHGRRLAAIQNGFEEYPVMIARGWSDERKRVVRLTENQFGLMSGWDQELIRAEIGMLKAEDYELSLLGFGESQLVQFTTTPGPPGAFPAVGEDIETEHQCPRCGYKWSGSSAPKKAEPAKPRKRKAKQK